MGKELCAAFPIARDTFSEADEVLGFKISEMCFDGDEDELKKTENTQPAILTTSIAAFRVLQTLAPELKVNFSAGHSLGEWSALTAAGALKFADAVRLVHQRGKLMQAAVSAGEGAMSAIIGLDADLITTVCLEETSKQQGVVSAANFNGPTQTVISGNSDAVARTELILKEKGAIKIARLAVSAPFHCPLMQTAADGMRGLLDEVTISEFSFPVISNVEATANRDPSRVASLLVDQITSPVRWVETVQFLAAKKETQAIELGAGRVLFGLNRRIDRSIKTLSAHDPASLEKALAAIEAH
jgi:[acyl-carrier-protein] S-malonyltransferase